MSVVYPKQNCVVAWSRGKTYLSKGRAFDSDAQIVRERPDLFTKDIEDPAGYRTAVRPPTVETATRAPGEVRKGGRGRPRLPRDENGNVIRD